MKHLIIGMILFLLVGSAWSGEWEQKANIPTARYAAGSTVVDGKIYVIGGTPDGDIYLAANEAYDPATDTWTKLAPMPTPRFLPVVSAVDGIIYAMGGLTGPNTGNNMIVEAYDPATDKWTRKADTPWAFGGWGKIPLVIDGKMYVMGGSPAPGVYIYDHQLDKWVMDTNATPYKLAYHTAYVLDGKIYVNGGSPNPDSNSILSAVHIYDPATQTWSKGEDLPRPRLLHETFVVNGKVYVMGGAKSWDDIDVAHKPYSIVDVYDPTSGTWTTAADMPAPRSDFRGEGVDGKIYIISGVADGGYDTTVATVEEYTPDSNVATDAGADAATDASASVSPAGKLATTWGQIRSAE